VTALAPEPVALRDSGDDSFTHVVCCNPNLALCGSDVTDVDWVGDDVEATCVVCAELEELACTRCGE
jgi:hypothetical protein